jgi:pilus assembly protein FimV
VQAEPETGMMPDFITLIIGGVGAVIIAVLGLLWWRKRKVEDETDTESMFASASEISLPDSSDDGLSVPVMEDDTSSYDVGTVGESSFLSEFTPSDFDAFDTDQNEVDPISEADVYLAYGRYQQAEDLMRQAIEDQPERDECKLKLLEIFYANENKSAFEEYATELISSGKSNDQTFWLKVVEMGAELDPDSTLYTELAGDKANFETEDSGADESTAVDSQSEDESVENTKAENETEFDLSVFDDDASVSEDGADEKTEDSSLDFDLSVFDLEESDSDQTEVSESKAGAEEVESVDFDLDAVALDSTKAEESIETEKTDEVEEEIESVDFDLDASPEAEVTDNIVLDSELDTEESLENFDFSGDESVSTESTSPSEEPETKEAESFETFDFDFDTEAVEPTPISAIDAQHDLDDGVSDLTDMDELETKIDLAKAYVDMGDSDAAKNIAEEVLKNGNEEQKKVAQEIIDQL